MRSSRGSFACVSTMATFWSMYDAMAEIWGREYSAGLSLAY